MTTTNAGVHGCFKKHRAASTRWSVKDGEDNRFELNMLLELTASTALKLGGQYSVTSLVKGLLRDQRRIHSVLACTKRFHDIEDEVFLSMLAEVGRVGILSVSGQSFDKQREAVASQVYHDAG